MIEPPIHPHDVRLVPAAVAGWTGTVVAITWGSASAVALAAFWVGVAIAAHLGRGRLSSRAFGLIAMAVIGGCYSGGAALYASQFETSPVVTAAGQRAWVSAAAIVTEDPRRVRTPGPATVSVRAELEQIDIAGRPIELGGRVTVLAPAEEWENVVPGQTVSIRGRLSPPNKRDLTLAVVRVGGPPLSIDAPSVVGATASSIRSSLAAAASDALPVDQAGLLPGLVVGDVSALPEEVETDFRAAGLTHLTAVSGVIVVMQ